MNSLGQIFKISIFGESHGKAVGVCIDGCPPGIEINEKDFFAFMKRRKSGKKGTTPRVEDDMPEIVSGVFQNRTTGSPITLIIPNSNTKSSYYKEIKELPRPGHADFAANKKFNSFNDYRGGGHFSGRLTAGIVAAGVIAEKIIKPVSINAVIESVGGEKDYNEILEKAIKKKDSLGGVINCKIKNLETGVGEPFFDSMESLISHAVFSIPGIKGIEFGAGFKAAELRGSENNDEIVDFQGTTNTNNAGGITGGLSNGNDIVFRVAVKPTSSIGKEQNTINLKSEEPDKIKVKGRHDSAFILRVPVIVESMAAIIAADLILRNKKLS